MATMKLRMNLRPGGKREFAVKSLDEARQIWIDTREALEQNGEGGVRQMGEGQVLSGLGTLVATVAYNGKIREVA